MAIHLFWENENSDDNDFSVDTPDRLIVAETGECLVGWLGGNWYKEGINAHSSRFLYAIRGELYKFQHEMTEEDVRLIVDLEEDWDSSNWECLTLNNKEKMVLLLRGQKYE